MGFIGTWLITTISVGVAIWLIPGIEVIGGAWAAPIFTALFLALVNAIIRPVLQVLSLPITILTLGIFALVINALMLELAGYLSRNITHNGIIVTGFGAAFLGAIVISIVSSILNTVIK